MENASENADVYIAADIKFHNSLAKATGNELISCLLDPIIKLLIEQRNFVIKANHGGSHAGQVFHKRILKALTEKDSEEARLAMINHLQQMRRDARHVPFDHDP